MSKGVASTSFTRTVSSETAAKMLTTSQPPAMTAEADDSRITSDKAVVCKELLGEKGICAHCQQPIERIFLPRRNPPGVDGDLKMTDERIAEYGGGDTGWRHIKDTSYYLNCDMAHLRASPNERLKP